MSKRLKCPWCDCTGHESMEPGDACVSALQAKIRRLQSKVAQMERLKPKPLPRITHYVRDFYGHSYIAYSHQEALHIQNTVGGTIEEAPDGQEKA